MGVIHGKRIIYLYRLLKNAAKSDATAMAFTTENTRSKEADADSVTTKDGVIRVPKQAETTISTTAIFSTESDVLITELENAIDNSDIVEVWEVNLDKPQSEGEPKKFAAKYYNAYVTSFELTSSSEDHAEAALEFAVNGKGAEGYATVTDEQQEIAALVFKDTKKEAAAANEADEASEDEATVEPVAKAARTAKKAGA